MESHEIGKYIIIPQKLLAVSNLSYFDMILYSQIENLSNEEGKCWASNRYLAEICGKVSNTYVSRSIGKLVKMQYLEKPEYIYKKESKEIEKRYLMPVNRFNLLQFNKESEPKIEINSEIIDHIEQLYKLYPRKVGCAKAKQSIKKSLIKDNFKTIENSLLKQIDIWTRDKTKLQFIPHPSTWFNEERWKDNVEEITNTKRIEGDLF